MNGNAQTDIQTISKYDRIRGNLHDLGDVALFTKPSTITSVQTLTGKAETFVVSTCRHEELGDHIFVECIDEALQVTRLCLPPKVANAIARQRESLSTTRRKKAGVRRAAALTEEDKQRLREQLKKAREHTSKRGKRKAGTSKAEAPKAEARRERV